MLWQAPAGGPRGGALFLDKDLGGPGYGQLKLGLLNEVLGRYGSAPQIFGVGAPDAGNMEMLVAYGTEEQKKGWLEPMLNQEIWSVFSMSESQSGSDPNLFKTHALRVGDNWIINGERWFTSAGRAAGASEGHSTLASTAPIACRPAPAFYGCVLMEADL